MDELVLQIGSFNALFALELCYRQQFAVVRRAFSEGLAKLRTHLSCTKLISAISSLVIVLVSNAVKNTNMKLGSCRRWVSLFFGPCVLSVCVNWFLLSHCGDTWTQSWSP